MSAPLSRRASPNSSPSRPQRPPAASPGRRRALGTPSSGLRSPPPSPARRPTRPPTASGASTSSGSQPRPWQRPVLAAVAAAAALAASPLALWGPGLGAARAAETVVEGRARVVDGDTLEVFSQGQEGGKGVKIRLAGIDAPEKRQACTSAGGREYKQERAGEQSAEALKGLIGSNAVRCRSKAPDQYGRQVGSCSLVASGVDVNQWAVSTGNAVAYRQYSKQYVPDEEKAREQHRGIWQGPFQEPAAWRRENKNPEPLLPPPPRKGASGETLVAAAPSQAQASPAGPSGDCRIKGNINNKGERIYHVPGSGAYDATQIDPSAGERFFCTAADAEAAGWRPAQGGRR